MEVAILIAHHKIAMVLLCVLMVAANLHMDCVLTRQFVL